MKHYKNLKPFHVDARGEMTYLIEGGVPIRSVLLITCKKGAIRANHIHKKDSHYSYLLEGSMEYYYKETEKSSLKMISVKKGEMIYTPPGEAHAMKFLEDSVFLAFTTEKRKRNKYEADLRRINLIK